MSTGRRTYQNKDITIIWQPDRCIHSKKCWTGLREVFDPSRRPWVDPLAATTETIINQILQCPSGALSYNRNNEPAEGPGHSVAAPVHTFECQLNGPLLVNGDIMIKKPDGTEEKRQGKVAFCRCGSSGNKPFCDGSHGRVGFKG